MRCRYSAGQKARFFCFQTQIDIEWHFQAWRRSVHPFSWVYQACNNASGRSTHRINTPFRLNIWQWDPTYSSCLLNMGKLTLSSCRKVVKEWKNKSVGMPDCDDAQSGSDSMWHQLLTTHSFEDFHCCLGWWVTVVKRWQASVRWSATGIFRENVCIVVFLFQTLNSGSQFSNSVDNVNVHLSPLLSRYLVELF